MKQEEIKKLETKIILYYVNHHCGNECLKKTLISSIKGRK